MSSLEAKSLVPFSGSKDVTSVMELYELLGWKYGGRLASDPVGIFDAGEYSISSA